MKPEIKKRIEQIRKGEVPEGYKKTKVGIVPGEWDVKQLKHILDQVERKVPKPQNGYWRLGLRSHAKGTFHEFIDDPNSIAMEELFSVAENDLIVNITFAWEHAIALANRDDEGKLVSHRFPTYVFNEKACPYFYKYYVIQPHFKKMLSEISPGGAGRNRVMSKSSFRKLFAVLPPLPEQEKIAEILSTWDKAIELKEQLIAGKKQQKKWLMQNLLTGKIRLPGFTDEWRERTLGDCCEGKGYYGLNAPATKFSEDLPLYLRITDIDVDGKYVKENMVCVDNKESYNYRLNINDIVFARTGASVGKSYLYNANDGDLVYAGFLIRFHINSKVANAVFIKYMCSTEKYWNWVSVMSARSGQPGINAEEYASFSLLLPSLPEQTAIADILTTADREIDLHEKQLEELKKQKKALMQLLLTGIVRVYAGVRHAQHSVGI